MLALRVPSDSGVGVGRQPRGDNARRGNASARTDKDFRPGPMHAGAGPADDVAMKITSTQTAAGIAVTMLALAACDRATTAEVRAETRAAGAEVREGARGAGQELREEAREAGEQLENAADRTQRALADMGERLRPEVKEATVAAKEHLAAAGEKTREALQGDGAITASIKASMLKDPDLSVLKIDVDTRDGVVVMNGLAGTEEARQRATRIAQGTKGVREVRNHLTVKHG
jgi:hyperosmotically inducible periplasmic protein